MMVRMLYVLPMLLGRTYDIRKHVVGIDIFPDDVVQNKKVIAETYYRSSYKTIERSSDVKDILGINGALSLNIKSGMFALKGFGAYLKESLSSENSVDILTKVSFRTYSESLPNSATPIEGWTKVSPEYVGTHFVQSIIYGGDLIACVRFEAVKTEYLQDIRGTVKASLEVGSALDLVGEGKLEMLEKKLEGKAHLAISFYGTVPLEGVPHTIDGLRDLVKNFEQHVKKVNNGWGVAGEVELGELSSFDNRFTFLRNSALESELEYFEESFDDLFSTKLRLKTWMASLPLTFSDEQEKKIEDLKFRISEALKVYFEVISTLNLEHGPEQLAPATEAYKSNGKSALIGKFKRELDKLIKRAVIEKDNGPHRGSSVYTRFGKLNCGIQNNTIEVLSGYMASSPIDTNGTGVNYLCLPKNPSFGDFESEDLGEPINGSIIRGMKYGLLEDSPFGTATTENMIFGGAVCAICLVDQRPTLETFHGRFHCPEEGDWREEYSGYLMTSTSVNRGQAICVDKKPDYHEDSYMHAADQSLIMVVMSERAKDEKQGETTFRFVPCVICSK